MLASATIVLVFPNPVAICTSICLPSLILSIKVFIHSVYNINLLI